MALTAIGCDNQSQCERGAMIPIRDLFEAHLSVSDLQRSMAFFGDVLGLQLAQLFLERKVAFYWVGGRGESMLGLWEVGTGPQRLSLHVAFRVDIADLLKAPERLGPPMSPHSTLREILPRSRSYLRGCRLLLSFSTTRTGICLNFSPCCQTHRISNWESFLGVTGRTVTASLSLKGSANNCLRPKECLAPHAWSLQARMVEF